jgi:hypothetical protein
MHNLWRFVASASVIALLAMSGTGCKNKDEEVDYSAIQAELVGNGSRVWTPHFAIYIRPDSVRYDTLFYIRLHPTTGLPDTLTSNRPVQQRFTSEGMLYLSTLNGPGAPMPDFKVWKYSITQPETIYIHNDTTPPTAYQQVVRFSADSLFVRLARTQTTTFYTDYQIVYLRNQ